MIYARMRYYDHSEFNRIPRLRIRESVDIAEKALDSMRASLCGREIGVRGVVRRLMKQANVFTQASPERHTNVTGMT